MHSQSLKNRKPNSIEKSFEHYVSEGEIINRREKEIEAAIRILKEKYDSYSDLLKFISYLEATEKLFTRAQVKGWENDRIKEEFIRFDIMLVSQDSNVDQNVFIAIFNDFKDFKEDVHEVYEVARQLMVKYEDKILQTFIQYLRDIFLEYIESNTKEETIEELRTRMIRVRMDMMVSSENVDMQKLQEIYTEFKNILAKQ